MRKPPPAATASVASPSRRSVANTGNTCWPDGIDVFIRRWNSTDWLATGKNSIHVWRFDPTGLCEPLAVRLTLDKSWAEDTYHPLTATITRQPV